MTEKEKNSNPEGEKQEARELLLTDEGALITEFAADLLGLTYTDLALPGEQYTDPIFNTQNIVNEGQKFIKVSGSPNQQQEFYPTYDKVVAFSNKMDKLTRKRLANEVQVFIAEGSSKIR